MELVKKCHENGSVWDNGKISVHHGDELKQGRKEQGVVVAMETRCSDLIQGGQLTDRSGCRPPAPTATSGRGPTLLSLRSSPTPAGCFLHFLQVMWPRVMPQPECLPTILLLPPSPVTGVRPVLSLMVLPAFSCSLDPP